MSDPLLTSLCAICHVTAPKYTCPRCSIRTCSLACIRKHKSWNSCSGVRDPTVYKPAKSLKTDSGIDHDYNYLYSMEKKISQSERELVEDRGVLKKGDLRPPTVREVKWVQGRDGRKRKVVTTRVLRDRGHGMGRMVEKKLEERGVRVLHAPTGMVRQKENKTSWDRVKRLLNWTVEWLELRDDGEVKQRIVGRSRDDVPIYRAYHDWIDSVQRKEALEQKWGDARSSHYFIQIPWRQTWNPAQGTVQDPGTSCWAVSDSLDTSDLWPHEVLAQKRGAHDYYLANPRQKADQPKKVTRLEIDDTLRQALEGTYVLEFPTIYFLPKGSTLPPGFVIGPKETHGTKREAPGPRNSETSKRRKVKDLEEGEVASDAGSAKLGNDDEDAVPAGALEVGDVVAEEIWEEDDLGEGEGEEEEDSDETSSEGTSSDGEGDDAEEDGEISE